MITDKMNLRSRKELTMISIEGLKEALGVVENVKKQDFVNPIVVYAKDFKSEFGFALALGAIAKHFKDSEDIVVRYSKPENKETKEIMTCFEVFRSKSKVFLKWLKERGEENPSYFLITSSKEIKESIKFLNSLGVKNDEGESISNCTEDMKKYFDPIENKIYVDIRLYDNIPTMSWSYVGKFYECDVNYEMFKEEVKGVVK